MLNNTRWGIRELYLISESTASKRAQKRAQEADERCLQVKPIPFWNEKSCPEKEKHINPDKLNVRPQDSMPIYWGATYERNSLKKWKLVIKPFSNVSGAGSLSESQWGESQIWQEFLVTIKLSEMLHELFVTCLCSGSHTVSQTKAELWEKLTEVPNWNWVCRRSFLRRSWKFKSVLLKKMVLIQKS